MSENNFEEKKKELEEIESNKEYYYVKTWFLSLARDWHVHYYRSQIREAEKTIALAKEKLGIALIKSKEKE